MEYVKLDDMVRLWACYWTAKSDETVIYRIREEVVDSDHMLDVKFDESSLRGILDKYRWYPEAMNREYGPLREWDRNTLFFIRLKKNYGRRSTPETIEKQKVA